jgi:hydroxymethylglutaryl-CoA synthase
MFLYRARVPACVHLCSHTMPSPSAAPRPADVGIRRMSLYVPRACVRHSDLERHDGCAPKYTVGLGQESMGVWDPAKEDVVSMALGATRDLLRHVDARDIGCVRVGTETLVDKSKSLKTHLVGLLADGGSARVEGVTHLNACYGGTDALFAAVAWVQSEAWDGRLALVVCADTAEYAPTDPARVTGGAGAAAMLVGPDAALVLEPRRATVSGDVHDFYKPELEPYPRVDGKLSQRCYLDALDACLRDYFRDDIAPVDYWAFHAPYAKLVLKASARVAAHQSGTQDEERAAEFFEARVRPGMEVCKRNGNMYTASLYGCLASLAVHGALAPGKRVAAYSYGSGYVASLFTLRARRAVPVDGYHRLSDARRAVVSPEAFERRLEIPTAADAYTLHVDDAMRRSYRPPSECTPSEEEKWRL